MLKDDTDRLITAVLLPYSRNGNGKRTYFTPVAQRGTRSLFLKGAISSFLHLLSMYAHTCRFFPHRPPLADQKNNLLRHPDFAPGHSADHGSSYRLLSFDSGHSFGRIHRRQVSFAMATRWFCTFCIMIPFFLVSCTANQNGTRSNKLIFLIVDGLPWQRINDDDVFPHMAQLRKEGTSVEYVKPVFPTVGYPNYFSLLTGTVRVLSCRCSWSNPSHSDREHRRSAMEHDGGCFCWFLLSSKRYSVSP